MPVYKDKERGTWYVTFRYTDWTGARKQKLKRGFTKKAEALDYERSFLQKQAGSLDMSFGSMYDIYKADFKTHLKSTTCENKEYLFESKILPFFSELSINDITPATIRNWQNQLINENEFTPTYLKTINNQLSAFFNFAVKYYELSSNPVTRAGSIGKKNADEMSFWTQDEFQTFLQTVEKPSSKVIFELLFWTGIRKGELLALTLNDFNFENQKMSITKSYARLKGHDIIGPPKTPKSIRTLPVPNFVLDELQDYMNRIIDYEPHERIFEYTISYLNTEMNRCCNKANIKKIRVHDLRHSHASWLIHMGCTILQVSERLGHENIETTLRTYSHLYPDKDNEILALMEKNAPSTIA